jgi:hypothetical protein
MGLFNVVEGMKNKNKTFHVFYFIYDLQSELKQQ